MTDTMPRYCDGRLSCPLGEIGESCGTPRERCVKRTVQDSEQPNFYTDNDFDLPPSSPVDRDSDLHSVQKGEQPNFYTDNDFDLPLVGQKGDKPNFNKGGKRKSRKSRKSRKKR